MSKKRRIGTLTFGITLLIFGILFLLHFFIPALTYEIIFKVWPMIFILLGGEVLFSALGRSKEYQIIYDKAAIALTGLLILFTMCTGSVSMAMEYGHRFYL